MLEGFINADDEADAIYYESEYKYVNEDYLEDEYDYDEEGIFDDLEYDDSDSEEEEKQDNAIYFSTSSEKMYVLSKESQIK